MSRSLRKKFEEKDVLTKGFIEIIAIWLVTFVIAFIFATFVITPPMNDNELIECKSVAGTLLMYEEDAVINGPENRYDVKEADSSVIVRLRGNLDKIEATIDPATNRVTYTYLSQTGTRIFANIIFSGLFAFVPFITIFIAVDVISLFENRKKLKTQKT